MNSNLLKPPAAAVPVPRAPQTKHLDRVLSFARQKIKGAIRRVRHAARFGPAVIWLPKVHVIRLRQADSWEPVRALWNQVLQEPELTLESDFKQFVCSHPLSVAPLCLAAFRKDRCVGFLLAISGRPNARGYRWGSIEAIGVHADWRHRGIGLSLYRSAMRHFREHGIERFAVCRNYLFFPGLHAEHHAEAVCFFGRRGFPKPSQNFEMCFRWQDYKKPVGLARARNFCEKNGISMARLTPDGALSTRTYLERISPNWLPVFEPLLAGNAAEEEEGMFQARRNGELIGLIHYIRADQPFGMAAAYRRAFAAQLLQCGPKKIFITGHFSVEKKYRGTGVATALFATFLESFFGHTGKVSLGDTAILARHHEKFGYRKIGVFSRFP